MKKELVIEYKNFICSKCKCKFISKDNEKGNYCLIIDKNPRVFNRRKYPRMPQDSEAIKEYVGKNYSE